MINPPRIRDAYIEAAAAIFGVDQTSIMQPTRGSPTESFARFYVYHALRQHNWSLTKISGLMNRHYTSIIYGIEQFKNAYRNPKHPFHSTVQSAVLSGKIERIADESL